ncbi:hypothetical protein K439DRAFT_1660605 [Ramaria rubella]|nr:hypothetical protein K439DRAFT_1660605 [Ramaria rubella]
MESLNMKTLASSLPNSANAEKQLMDNFKAAALSITTLYRSSLDTSKQAYSTGYATCLLDVLHFVEAGVSVSGNAGEEMTIGRVMDWIEARLEAIKSTAEEEEEDRMKDGPVKLSHEDVGRDEREKRIPKVGSGPSGVPTQSKLHRRSKENLQDVPQPISQQMPSPRLPSTSSPAHTFTSPSPPPPSARAMRPKRGLKDLGPTVPFNTTDIPLPITIPPNNGASPFTFSADVVSPLTIVGSKRRHAAMLSESPASSSAAIPSGQPQGGGHGHGHNHSHGAGRRKRGRSGRERETYQVNVNTNAQTQGNADAMEVEDEGRERKRVARR